MTIAAVSTDTTANDLRTLRSSGLWRRILRRPTAIIALGWLILVVGGSSLASWVAPYSPTTQDLTRVYSGPNSRHWLGTDQLGRDILSRLLFGGRTSMLVTAEAIALYAALGILFGLIAGYNGGVVGKIIHRFCDLLLSIPAVVMLLVVLAIFAHNESAAMLSLGVLASAGLVRVVSASAAVVREEPFVAAARVAGLTTPQILRRHILPQVAGPVISLTSIVAGSALLVEVSLAYLGLGVQPPAPSWGGLIADASQAIYRQPWMLVPSGGVIVLTAVALALLGDAARDATSDRSRSMALSWRTMHTPVRRASAAAKADVDNDAVPGSVLECRNLSVDIRRSDGTIVRVVDQVGLEVRPGEALGLAGESGCGKSMTVSAILRLLPPGAIMTAHSVSLSGRDLIELSERGMNGVRGAEIGYIAQEPVASLDPSFTVGSQLIEVVRRHDHMERRAARTHARMLLEAVHLSDADAVMAKYPHELSGGMAQRVGIARALARRPKLLIADEPTTALDVTVQAEILDLLRELRQERGMALILVTHDWGVVADSCDRAAVMYAGQIVETGPVAALFANPQHRYTEALLAANPSAAQAGQRLPVIPGSVPKPGQWPTGCRFRPRCSFAGDTCRSEPIPLTALPNRHQHNCVHPHKTGRDEVNRVHVRPA